MSNNDLHQKAANEERLAEHKKQIKSGEIVSLTGWVKAYKNGAWVGCSEYDGIEEVDTPGTVLYLGKCDFHIDTTPDKAGAG